MMSGYAAGAGAGAVLAESENAEVVINVRREYYEHWCDLDGGVEGYISVSGISGSQP